MLKLSVLHIYHDILCKLKAYSLFNNLKNTILKNKAKAICADLLFFLFDKGAWEVDQQWIIIGVREAIS